MKSSYHLVCLLAAAIVFSLAGISLGMNDKSVDKSHYNNNNTDSTTSFFYQASSKGKNELLAENKSFSNETEEQKIKRIKVVITAYSSEVEQTDDTPHITANGTLVKDGIVANNMLPFGTKIKIPSLYGNKVFTVTDRMNARKGNYAIDIWFPTTEEAINFGVKETYIEVSQI
ncbi:3D domain-containing protein [bacterium]|nr:3D domain-containing protein [bacterium]